MEGGPETKNCMKTQVYFHSNPTLKILHIEIFQKNNNMFLTAYTNIADSVNSGRNEKKKKNMNI